MSNKDYREAALFELRFWLQILGDHGRFMFNALSSKEVEEIQRAQYFISVFDQLLSEARKSLSENQIVELTAQAKVQAEQIRLYKLHLLSRHLVGEIIISLPPTFINHMVNEVEECITILDCLSLGQIPPAAHPLHYHLLWLRDTFVQILSNSLRYLVSTKTPS